MKRIVIRLLVLFLVFGGAYYTGKRDISLKEVAPSFQATAYPVENRPFAVVIIGHNHGAYLEKTLTSISSQNYPNFRVIYVDDASTDGSFGLAQDLLNSTGHRVTCLRNEEPLGFLTNLALVVQNCLDDEIVAVVGGADWLAHEWVLSRLNQYYANPGLWITYGQSAIYPNYQLGEVRSPDRTQPLSSMRLNTFYAGLFKEIGSEDFFGEEISVSSDLDMAYMIPMLEMAQGHSSFIPEIFYVSNSVAAVRESPEVLTRCEKMMREMASYEPLSKWGGQ